MSDRVHNNNNNNNNNNDDNKFRCALYQTWDLWLLKFNLLLLKCNQLLKFRSESQPEDQPRGAASEVDAASEVEPQAKSAEDPGEVDAASEPLAVEDEDVCQWMQPNPRFVCCFCGERANFCWSLSRGTWRCNLCHCVTFEEVSP